MAKRKVKISEYFSKLSLSFSIKDDVPAEDILKLRTWFNEKKYSKCILYVRDLFHLSIPLKIIYLKKSIRESDDEIVLACIHVSDKCFQKGMAGKLKLRLFILPEAISSQFELFIYVVAHEIAHIALFSAKHELRQKEIATDLLAMMSGFLDVIKIGRKVSTTKSKKRIGYLTDYWFNLFFLGIKKEQASRQGRCNRLFVWLLRLNDIFKYRLSDVLAVLNPERR